MESARRKLPQIDSRNRTGPDQWGYALSVSPELSWFAGHFPGQPVLPGVAQIGWAILFARQAFGLDADPSHIERVKFQQPIRPGDRVQLDLVQHDDEGRSRIDWCFRGPDRVFSRGRFEFFLEKPE
ncbi:MAG: hypothetical protein L0I62_04850 [Gammaproteobacteria bacterium]|nr:hypothetical protein [Gammaproteobacteria bacterium]